MPKVPEFVKDKESLPAHDPEKHVLDPIADGIRFSDPITPLLRRLDPEDLADARHGGALILERGGKLGRRPRIDDLSGGAEFGDDLRVLDGGANVGRDPLATMLFS
jgi:hypothetical protein